MWAHLEFHNSSEDRAHSFLFQMSSKHPFKESLLGVRSIGAVASSYTALTVSGR